MAFLTARWESLVLLNYRCPASLLAPLVPRGTILDTLDGEALVSLVGFMFADTRLLGLPVPFHRTFEEVNLRFYVRREGREVRRAVVFVRELVPRAAIATVARVVYNEPYLAVPMRHDVALAPDTGGTVRYGWRHGGADFEIGATASGAAAPLVPGSEAEFITEHYWGYTRQRDGRTLEYQVEHPSWRVWTAERSWFTGPAGSLYGPAFAGVLAQPPRSAFIAVGSAIEVHRGRLLP
ncbi:hypothetical protein TBR22_A41610 [Luteitalea sp. TBR-22]|uniref:YqjF family protein n=1 Tax=Luteitalea sp. TBR-22 TaxID=2802971 RepID=UPI001AF70D14|nr:DUF2071 domain-containing protein [Luteitalea sp. TBR-22]BCS34935.1 hypothetical protein TBR22_A41610 [Luteitalea sp. TBR-22]